MKVGVIGLGAMGSGMAANLQRAGLLAAVWNRSADKAEAFGREYGAQVAATPAELAMQCDIVITCVSRADDVLEVVDALLPGVDADTIVIDTSTVEVAAVNTAAQRLSARGAAFLDAPVSGGAEGARNGQLVVMVGGDEAVLTRARPALDAIAKAVTHMGPLGSGQATKAVNQIMAAGVIQAVSEALAFGEAVGLDMDKVIDVVGGGAAGNWLLSHRGPAMVRGRFEPGFKLALHHKDLNICRAMLADMNAALPLVEMTLHHYEKLMAQGHGDDDISGLYRLKQELLKGGNKKSL